MVKLRIYVVKKLLIHMQMIDLIMPIIIELINTVAAVLSAAAVNNMEKHF